MSKGWRVGNCDINIFVFRHRFWIATLKFLKFQRVQNSDVKFWLMQKWEQEIMKQDKIFCSLLSNIKKFCKNSLNFVNFFALHKYRSYLLESCWSHERHLKLIEIWPNALKRALEKWKQAMYCSATTDVQTAALIITGANDRTTLAACNNDNCLILKCALEN